MHYGRIYTVLSYSVLLYCGGMLGEVVADAPTNTGRVRDSFTSTDTNGFVEHREILGPYLVAAFVNSFWESFGSTVAVLTTFRACFTYGLKT